MALNVYAYNDEGVNYDELYSQGETFDNPIQCTLDGTHGGVVLHRLALSNYGTGITYYTSVEITPVVSAFITCKIIVQEAEPTANQWAATSSNVATSFGSIGAPNTSTDTKAFWLRVVVPEGTSVQNVRAQLHLVAVENA